MMQLEYLGFLCFVVLWYMCIHMPVQVCVYLCEDQRLIAGVFLSHPPPSFLRQDPSASLALGLQTVYVPSFLCRSRGRLILMLTWEAFN